LDPAVFGLWVKKVVAGLLLLPTGPLLAIIAGLVLGRWHRRLGTTLVVLGVSILVLFSLPIVSNAIAASNEAAFPPLHTDVPLPPHTAIVVLGGGMQLGSTDYDGETINAITLTRLRSAARLAARTRLPILVTGGRPQRGRTTEGDQMAEALVNDFKTPVRWIENRSLDTEDNARLSVPMLEAAGIRTAIIVTDASHMARSRRYFERAGVAVIPAPTDYYAHAPLTVLSFIPNANALRRSAFTVHEWAGSQWALIRD
jgi:uncharacterized SAM-binding protein YcdF (DUF218 family)